uniref:Uncharacterized protein n=1 Tax=Chromera velia CCMP2878 TaxID=1169474 RepID=A0A0G4I6N2_9ALVE|eukprot:Cvel_11449.t1-p1 / transcript=Cvel_11449.t1 / gene=Cvel_11449 / organism=Chromera_velia_CCMP2878 / gene_product=hypothetical protein / transcript_product=hypothetical protein / location=Cvel_scaffold720:40678-41070(-) / protein_length=131 / sequence_SO=supercontig / SO=protein_coding / is_pseudo=false
MTPPGLRLALQLGVLYFCCMAAAHFTSFKKPVLFVYYDVPFYAYQDKIISFAVISYALLFHAASRHEAVVPYALASLAVTVVGLSAVNVSDALEEVAKGGPKVMYWLQTGAILTYLVLLLVLYTGKKQKRR